MAKIIKMKSGTDVAITEETVEINRISGKSSAKTLFIGHTSGRMVIKKKLISSVIYDSEHLMIFAAGLPAPSDFKISNIVDIEQYPNCIVGSEEELAKIYVELVQYLRNT